ncbi:MAG: hypothetical protein A1D16_14165 [Flavihumibacter sp. CACIAM 22H1]|nr:MAG: hypothetical protein A1D16_14165 [Flavihumibacter sp. CACIAM 22H1]
MQLKSIVAAMSVAVLVGLSAAPVFANTEKKAKAKDVPVEVKYIGSNDQSPIVELSLNNESGEEITVQLRDMDGYVLYSVTSSDKKITRKFQIDNHSMEPIQLKVAVAKKGKVQTDVFQINRSRVVVEDVVVAKM